VAPGAEILQMDIADGEHRGCIGERGTDFEDGFRPPPKSRAQKRKRRLRHLFVLAADVLPNERTPKPLIEPIPRVRRRLDDVRSHHAVLPQPRQGYLTWTFDFSQRMRSIDGQT